MADSEDIAHIQYINEQLLKNRLWVTPPLPEKSSANENEDIKKQLSELLSEQVHSLASAFAENYLTDEGVKIQEKEDTSYAMADGVPVTTHIAHDCIGEYREGYQLGLERGVQRATQMLTSTHKHKFTYLLNQAHTLVAGCECGLVFGGLVAGSVDNLVLHPISLDFEEDTLYVAEQA